MPVGPSAPYAPASRSGKGPAPEFAPGAAVAVKTKAGTLTVAFPQALGNPAARAFSYRVTVAVEGRAERHREVVDPGFNRPPSLMRVKKPVTVLFKGQQAPAGARCRVTVVPLDSLGNAGKGIGADQADAGIRGVVRPSFRKSAVAAVSTQERRSAAR